MARRLKVMDEAVGENKLSGSRWTALKSIREISWGANRGKGTERHTRERLRAFKGRGLWAPPSMRLGSRLLLLLAACLLATQPTTR